MFEIRCIVADKRLAELLKIMKNLTLEPPVIIPVDDEGDKLLQLTNGATIIPRKEKYDSGQNAVTLVATLLKKTKQKTISAKEMREYLLKHGYSRNGYSYAQQQLCKQGILRKTREFSIYEVI